MCRAALEDKNKSIRFSSARFDSIRFDSIRFDSIRFFLFYYIRFSSIVFSWQHAHSVTVPGAAAAWCDAVERWGSLPLPSLLAPAIKLAEEGFPVAPLTAHFWRQGEEALRRNEGGARAELLVADETATGGARCVRPSVRVMVRVMVRVRVRVKVYL